MTYRQSRHNQRDNEEEIDAAREFRADSVFFPGNDFAGGVDWRRRRRGVVK